jgi:dienelactone hydrolase
MRTRISAVLVLSGLVLSSFGHADTITWEQLKAMYDVAPLTAAQVHTTERKAIEGTYVEFDFPSESGDRAYGTFVRPNSKGPFPLVVLFHGLAGSGADMISQFAKPFLSKGVAVLALDAPHSGHRATSQDRQDLQSTVMKFAMSKDQALGLGVFMFKENPEKNSKFAAETIQGGVKDARRALDWIKSPEYRVDSSQIGALGISLGSMMASILSGVDARIDADLLVIGGDPIAPFLDQVPAGLKSVSSAVAPSLFLPHSTAHVMMLNGYRDTVIPRADTFRLYESAPGATLVFYDTPGDMGHFFGHSIAPEGYAYGVDWLTKMVAVPKPAERAHTPGR